MLFSYKTGRGDPMIREATVDDLDGLITMYKALIEYHKDFGPSHQVTPRHFEVRRKFYRAVIEKSTREHKLGLILLAEEEGKPVGMFMAQYITSQDGHKYERQAFLQDLFVYPDCRRKHVGIQLTHETIMRCKQDGVELVYIWVAPQNTHVQSVVTQQMGFELAFNFNTLIVSEYKKPKMLK